MKIEFKVFKDNKKDIYNYNLPSNISIDSNFDFAYTNAVKRLILSLELNMQTSKISDSEINKMMKKAGFNLDLESLLHHIFSNQNYVIESINLYLK